MSKSLRIYTQVAAVAMAVIMVWMVAVLMFGPILGLNSFNVWSFGIYAVLEVEFVTELIFDRHKSLGLAWFRMAWGVVFAVAFYAWVAYLVAGLPVGAQVATDVVLAFAVLFALAEKSKTLIHWIVANRDNGPTYPGPRIQRK